jgi:RNA polymerase-binding transcription factor DksA
MTKCTHCGQEIHPKRLEILPNAKTCVACSTTQRKAGLTVMKGTECIIGK